MTSLSVSTPTIFKPLPIAVPGQHLADSLHRETDPRCSGATSVTIIVPTLNEAPNVVELVRRIEAAVGELDAEVVFVDDSTDETPVLIAQVALTSTVPIRLIHRATAVGGLSGAVLEGVAVSNKRWCLVIDADLQHPPEQIPFLLDSGESAAADVVVASRHLTGGSVGGLQGGLRKLVSASATALTRGMFPIRLRNCSDPMTGFFAVRTSSMHTADLQPRGFKILLEILVRRPMTVVEVPFIFGQRHDGKSKASVTQGLRFVRQLAALRFGRLSRFAAVGAFGAALNLAIMISLLSAGINYIASAVIGSVVTIITNFLIQERLVFHDLRQEGRGFWRRFVLSAGFNGAETGVRLPFLYLIVQFTTIHSVVAQALTLIVAFLVRFVYHSRVVYRPRRNNAVMVSAMAMVQESRV